MSTCAGECGAHTPRAAHHPKPIQNHSRDCYLDSPPQEGATAGGDEERMIGNAAAPLSLSPKLHADFTMWEIIYL